MILYCSYEEIRALKEGARAVLDDGAFGPETIVAAPPESRAQVEALVPLLDDMVRVTNLEEQRAVQGAVAAIVSRLRVDMEAMVLSTHPADEGAVAAYFDFAHALSVLRRVRELGEEMAAIIEVVTGRPPDESAAATFRFPS